jgi:hypothetical protein
VKESGGESREAWRGNGDGVDPREAGGGGRGRREVDVTVDSGDPWR